MKKNPALLHLRLILVAILGLVFLQSPAQIRADTNVTPESVVKDIFMGSGIKVRNIKFKGHPHALGKFESENGLPNFNSGFLLSTGNAYDAAGPNQKPKTSTWSNIDGDPYLKRMCKCKTYDAATLEFDFLPEKDSISLKFFYASEEYPEFVGTPFNDVFVILLTGPGYTSGKNLGVVPGTREAISANTVNYRDNGDYFLDNNHWNKVGQSMEKRLSELDPEIHNGIEFDGMTRVIGAGCKVKPRGAYHLKITIADVGDQSIDSGIFFEAGSFESLEQRKHEIRRARIAEERRQDSLAVVAIQMAVLDSLAELRRMEVLDSLAALGLDSVETQLNGADSLDPGDDRLSAGNPDSSEEGPDLPPLTEDIPLKKSLLLQYEDNSFHLPESAAEELKALAETAKKYPGTWFEIYCPHFEWEKMEQANRLADIRSDWIKYTLIEAGAMEELVIMKRKILSPEEAQKANQIEVKMGRD